MKTDILPLPQHTPANYLRHMNAFLDRIEQDKRLTLCHIGLYLALFRCWNRTYFRNPFYVSRADLMQVGHIGSPNTYARCIKELENFGYINYFPPGSKGTASMVSIIPMNQQRRTKAIQGDNENDTENRSEVIPPESGQISQLLPGRNRNDTAPVSVAIPINKQTNLTNNEIGSTPPTGKRKKKKFKPPARDEVIACFRSWRMPEAEAVRFYLHYQANGWYQSGKVAIQDWKAAAEKWILNAGNFKTKSNGTKPGNLNANQGGSYSEPL
ncbi:hypothetical protein [Chitinophaga sp. 22620]|uniref:hypothetical protein n=1 Tax=Chitinophaga sp. 22620 TaxID=3453952 RepID=UPI003F86E592